MPIGGMVERGLCDHVGGERLLELRDEVSEGVLHPLGFGKGVIDAVFTDADDRLDLQKLADRGADLPGG